MFGIIRPCRHRLSPQLQASWLGHLCGLCLALRDDHGQLARTATNYDGLIISVLVEAQGDGSSDDGRRTAGPCPLRGMRTARVVQGEGARLAAAVSLTLAAAKVRDHVADQDGIFRRQPVAVGARLVARRWERQSSGSGSSVGFDTGVLLAAVSRQGELELTAGLGSSVLLVTEPTETATGLAFAHTAHLAGRPRNAAPLEEAGRLFGRLAHLLDAAEDLAADAAAGAWNPLTATGTDLTTAHRLCRDAVHGIRLALREVEFTDRALAHSLLAHETEQAVKRVFGHRHDEPGSCGPRSGPAPAGGGYLLLDPSGSKQQPWPWLPPGPDFAPPVEEPKRPRRRGPIVGCAVWALMCGTCQLCCRDPYPDPWSREPKEGWCSRNSDSDCDGCDGCDGCDCGCDCCDCCDCSC